MKLQDEETNDEYKSPVNRTKLRSTVCLINPNTKNTIMMQKKYPKSAPITSMDKSNMNKNNSLHPQLPLSCTLGPIATNKDESKCVITTHATHKTVLIIDWDDTLLPSYYLQEIGLRPSTKQQSPSDKTPHKELSEPQKLYVLLSLKKLEKLIHKLLHTAFSLVGDENVIIITNAEQGWVELSCSTFMPNIFKILQKCTIISARSTFEKLYPSSAIEWKRRAIKMVLDHKLNTDININKTSAFKHNKPLKAS
eukprot:257651_1